MAVDGGYGPKGYPKFDPNGAPEDWVDLEAVGAYAGTVGNRMVGTKAERDVLSASTTAEKQRWDGLEFWQTDSAAGSPSGRYVMIAGTWRFNAETSGSVTLNTTSPTGWAVRSETGLDVIREGPWVGLAGSVRNLYAHTFSGTTLYPVGAVPAELRPTVQRRAAVVANSWTGNLVVDPSGALSVYLGHGTPTAFGANELWLFLDTARWRV